MQIKIDVDTILTTMTAPELYELRLRIDTRLADLANTDTLTPSEIQFCEVGRYIPAIKSVRERTGLGLKDAKDLVDRWRAANGCLPSLF